LKVIITGSSGLIGSNISQYYLNKGFNVIGIDNDQRKEFFGNEASNKKNLEELSKNKEFISHEIDIRNSEEVKKIFNNHKDVDMVIHAAAQPSHDWARENKIIDFDINASSTLHLLETIKTVSTDIAFVYLSTNKVYGDNPNKLDFVKGNKRYDLEKNHKYYAGIDTSMEIDGGIHSFFGISKLTADLIVQEYGKTYDMKTICLRGGCLTGSNHNGAKAHGFLSYLVKCAKSSDKYVIEGYEGLQVRDNIDAYDVSTVIEEFRKNPGSSEVFNIGGGRDNSISIIEAIEKVEKILNKKMNYEISSQARLGDHIWYITDNTDLYNRFPDWKITKNIDQILDELINLN